MVKGGSFKTGKYDKTVIAHGLSSRDQIKQFCEGIQTVLLQVVNSQRGKVLPFSIGVHIVTEQLKFEPMVDCKWACAALPCSPHMLRLWLHKKAAQLDPPVYRRVKRPGAGFSRIRLLSLHDLRVLRGAMLIDGPGKTRLRDRGDIE